MRDEHWIKLAAFLEKLEPWLGLTAMVFLPWTLAWWTIGLVVATPFVLNRWLNNNRDGAIDLLQFVFSLPANALIWPVLWPVAHWIVGPRIRQIETRQREEKEKKLQELFAQADKVSVWLLEQFAATGISVAAGNDEPSVLEGIVCNPSLDQISRYQEIYAEAVRKFPTLPPEAICGKAQPLEPLDKAWADKLGIKAYARTITVKCSGCGREASVHIAFSDTDDPKETPENKMLVMIFGDIINMCEACQAKRLGEPDDDGGNLNEQ